MTYDNVKIRLDNRGKGEVIVNGEPLKSSTAIRIVAQSGAMTWITICMLADVEYEGPAELLVTTDEATRKDIEHEVNGPDA